MSVGCTPHCCRSTGVAEKNRVGDSGGGCLLKNATHTFDLYANVVVAGSGRPKNGSDRGFARSILIR